MHFFFLGCEQDNIDLFMLFAIVLRDHSNPCHARSPCHVSLAHLSSILVYFPLYPNMIFGEMHITEGSVGKLSNCGMGW